MRLQPQDWQELETEYQETPPADAGKIAAEGALLDLHDQVTELQQLVADLENSQAFNVRAEALKQARMHVAALPSEQENSRGYRDHALPPSSRIDQELKVAQFLLEGK